jgi:hypothetical protein
MKLPVPEKPSAALRSAIERTFEATAGQAADTRDRAAELLDEVTTRGRKGLGRIESKVRGGRNG